MRREYPDGPRIYFPLVIVAQLLPRFFPFDPLAFTIRLARQFGDIAHYRVGPLHVYQLNHPDMVRQVLVEQAEKFHKPRLLKRAFRPFAGEGLLTSDGAFWKQQRKLIQPAFHQRQLAAYGEVMVTLALRMVDTFEDGQVREIEAEMAKLTLEVVVRTLFGADLPGEEDEISQCMLAVLDAATYRLNSPLGLPAWVPTKRNLRERRALAKLDGILHALIQIRRASGEKRGDLLSVLLAAADGDGGAPMSDQQLRDEMMTLFLAGQETTANALTWTWYLLSQHPEAEAKLLEELDRVLAGRAPALSDLPNLPFTEMVIREALRLYPPGPGFAREPTEDVVIGGYDVPKGSIIMISPYALQRDERFFPDPEWFDPDRFSADWEERVPRYAYLPFGGGPRVCIGNAFAMMEARLILSTVTQHYKLSLEPNEEIAPVQLVTLRPRGPVRMKLARRKNRATQRSNSR